MPGRKRIRVMHLSRVIYRHDFVDTLIRHADQARFQMMTCVFAGDRHSTAPQFGSDCQSFVLNIKSRRDYASAVVSLARLLRRELVDIIHAHHFDEGILATAAIALTRVPRLIIGRHYHDEIYLLARGIHRKLILGFESVVNRAASVVIVPSPVIGSMLISRQRVPAKKIEVIPYAVDFTAEKYRPLERSEAERIREEFSLGSRFVVANVGRHHPLKGQEYLIRAFGRFCACYPQSTLLMIGDGPCGAYLRALASDLGLLKCGKVVFLGWRTDAARLIGAADVIVHPTLHEALPQVMIEAMAKERPLIITHVSGACDFGRDGENAFIIPTRDEIAILQALLRVRENYTAAEAIGRRARLQITAELSLDRIVPRFESVYNRVVSSSGGRLGVPSHAFPASLE